MNKNPVGATLVVAHNLAIMVVRNFTIAGVRKMLRASNMDGHKGRPYGISWMNARGLIWATTRVAPTMVFLILASSAHAATLYWVGGSGDGVTVNANDWSTTNPASCNDGGGDAGAVPGASDLAVFDADCDNNAAIGAIWSVAGIRMDAGYTGSVTHSDGFTLTIGTSDFVQNDGTFTLGSSGITLSTADLTINAGAFNPNGNPVTFSGSNAVWTPSTETYQNVIFSKLGGSTMTIAAGTTADVDGDLTLTDGYAAGTGTIAVAGNVSVGAAFDGPLSTTRILLDGAGAQSLSSAASTAAPWIDVNKSGGTASLTSAFNAAGLTVTAGTFDPAGYTFTLGGSISGTWTPSSEVYTDVVINKPSSTLTVTAGTTADVNGNLTLTDGYMNGTGTIAVAGNISLGAGYDGPFTSTKIMLDGTGAQSLSSGGSATAPWIDINKASGTASLTSAFGTAGLTVTSGTLDPAGYTLTFGGGASGTWTPGAETYTDVVINKPGAALSVTAGTTADVNGNLSLNDGYMNGTGVITVAGDVSLGAAYDGPFTSTKISLDGTGAQSISSSGSATAPWIDINKASGTASLTSAFGTSGLTVTAGTFDPAGYTLTLGGGASGTWTPSTETYADVVVNKAGGVLTVTTGTTADVDGDLNLNDGFMNGTGTITVAGDLSIGSAFDGPFTAVKVSLDGGGAQNISSAGSATAPWLDINKAGGTASFTSNFKTVALTVTSGTLDPDGYTLTFAGIGGSWTPGAEVYGDVVLNNAPAIMTLSASPDIDGNLTLTNGYFNGSALIVSGNVTVASTYDGGSAPLTFDGGAVQTFDLTGATGTFNGDISVDKSGGQVNLLSALIVDAASQDLTIVEGTFDLNGFNLTESGSGVFTVQDGGNFQLEGGETFAAPTLSSGSTVTYDGDTVVLPSSITTYYNLTLDESGTNDPGYTLPDAHVTVQGVLSITDGQLLFDNDKNLIVQDGAATGAAITVGAAGEFYNFGTGDLTLHADVSNSGSIVFNSSDDAGNGLVISSNDATNRNWQGSGSFSVGDVTVNDQDCTGGTPASITAVSSTDGSGDNTNWDFGTVPAAFTWIGEGADNNWTTTANWQGGVVPGAANTAIFDDTSIKNATINANVSVAGIDIQSGYTGTITQSGAFTVTVGTSGWTQADGTFTGGSGAITMSGTFAQSGGTFTSTSGTFTLRNAADFTRSGGTFTHNSGTFDLKQDNNGNVQQLDGATTFYNFIISGTGQSTVLSDDIIIENNFTVTNNYPHTLIHAGAETHTISVRGDVAHTGANGMQDDLTIIMDGTAGQTLIGTGCLGSVQISNTTAAVTLAGDASLCGSLTIDASAELDATASDYDITITNHNWTNNGTFTEREGTVTFHTSSPATVIVTGVTTFYDLAFTGNYYNYHVSDDLTVLNDLTMAHNYNSASAGLYAHNAETHTISVAGNVTKSAVGFVEADLRIVMNGTTTQTVSTTGSRGLGDLQISNTTDEVQMISNLLVIDDIIVDSGAVFDLAAYNVAGAAATAFSNNGTLQLTGDNTFTSATPAHAAGSIVEFTATSGSRVLPNWTYSNLEINGSGGAFTLPDANVTLGRTLEVAAGTLTFDDDKSLTIQDGAATGTALTVGASGALHNLGTGDLTLHGDVANSGTIVFNSSDDAGNGITISSNDTTNRNWQGSGSFSMGDVTVNDQDATGGTPATIYAVSSTDGSGDNTNWDFGTVPAAFTWIGEGADNNWATGANWQGGVAPGASDVAIFNDVSTKDATIAANLSVGGIDINSGYTGTITQADAVTLTVGTGDFVQDDGTFVVGSSGITFSDVMTVNGGTFDPDGNTVTFSGTSNPTWTPGGETYQDVVMSKSDISTDLFIATGATATIAGNLTLTGGELRGSGTINVAGNLSMGANARNSSSAATVTLNGAGAQTISGTGNGPIVEIDKASGTASLTSDVTVTGLIVTSGTFDPDTYTLTLGGIATGAVWAPGGETYQNVILNKSDAQSSTTIQAGTTATITNSLTLTDGVFAGTGTINLAGDLSIGTNYYRSTSVATVTLNGTGAQSVTGSSGHGPVLNIDKASGTASLAADTALSGLIVTNGTFDPAGYALMLNPWSNNTWTPGAETYGNVTVNVIDSFAALTISAGETAAIDGNLVLTNGSLNGTGVAAVAGDLTVAATFDGGSGVVTLNGTSDQTVTHTAGGDFPSGTFTINKASGSAILAANLSVNVAGQDLTIVEGTLDLAGYDLTVNDAFTVQDGGILKLQGGETVSDPGTLASGSTVMYSATSGSRAIKSGAAWDYQSLAINGAGGTFTLGGAEVANENLTVTAGTFDLSDQTLSISGNAVINGGTMQTGTAAVTFGDGAGDTVTISSGTLTIESDGDSDITVNAGTWTNSGGTIQYTADGAQTFLNNATIQPYYNLTINDGDGTFATTGNIDINGAFTLTDGTFDLDTNDNNINVAGSFTLTAGTYSPGSGTLTLDGDLTFTDSIGTSVGIVAIGTSPDTTDLATDMICASLTVNLGDVLNTNGYDIDCSGDITVVGTFDATDDGEGDTTYIYTGGSWTASGTFTAADSTVLFDGTAAGTLTSGSQNFYNLTINDGLVGYWKLDETVADSCPDGTSDACDASGYLRHGNWTNSPVAPTTNASVSFANAYSFDTNNTAYITLTDDAAFDFGSGDFSVAFWVQKNHANSSNSDTWGVNKWNTGGSAGTNEWALSLATASGNDIPGFSVEIGSTSYSAAATSALTIGRWHHLTGVRNGTDLYLYVDGVQAGTVGSVVGAVNNLGLDVMIAESALGNSSFRPDAVFDDVRLYNRALSAAEAAALGRGDLPATAASGSSVTLEDALDVNGDLVINSGDFDNKPAEDNAITVAGSWMNNGGKFTNDGGTVMFDGTSGTHSIQAGNEDFNIFQVNGSGGTWNLAQDVMITDDLDIDAGTLDTSGYDLVIVDDMDIDANLDLASGHHSVGGVVDFTSGTITADTSTLVMNPATAGETLTAATETLTNLTLTSIDALVGWWTLDEGADDTCAGGVNDACDSSGNGNDGAISSSEGDEWSLFRPSVNFSNPYSLMFNSDLVNAGSAAELDNLNLSDGMSFSAWVYPTTAAGSLISKNDVGSGAWNFALQASGRIMFDKDGAGDMVARTAINAYSLNQWQHIAFAWDGGVNGADVDIYVNGVVKTHDLNANGSAFRSDASSSIRFGSSLVGYMDDVRFYNRVLTAAEINALYHGHPLSAAGGAVTLQDTLDIDGDLSLGDGSFDASGQTITVGGSWINDAAVYTHNDNSVTFNGTSGTEIVQQTDAFYDVIVNDGGGTLTLTLASDIDIDNDLTITGGTLDASTDNYALYVGGSFTNADTFTSRSGRVVLDGTGAETLTSNGSAFYDLYVNDGLVGYWKLDEAAANSCAGGTNDACDSSGFGYDGTWNGNAAANASVPTLSFRNVNSLSLDGTADYVAVTTAVVSSPPYTFAAWVNGTTGTIVSIADSALNTDYARIHIASSTACIGIRDTAGNESVSCGATDISSGWHHVVGVFRASNDREVYVNGISENTNTDDRPSFTADRTGIGRVLRSSVFGDYNGLIDDVRVYNRALSATEIMMLGRGDLPATAASGSSVTLTDALDVDGDLVVNSGDLNNDATSDYAITVAGSWTNNGGKFTNDGGTVSFDGTSGTHYVQGGHENFHNMTVSGNGGTWNLAQDVMISQDFTLASSATLDTNAYDLVITNDMDIDGNLDLASGYHSVQGSIDLTSGTVTPDTSTVVLNPATVGETMTAAAETFNNVVLTSADGLVGWWTLDETALNTCNAGADDFCDSSGNAYHADESGGVTITTNTAPVHFLNAAAVTFDGANDHLSMGDVNDLTEAVTIAAWVRLSGAPHALHGDGVLAKGVAGDGNSGSYELTLLNDYSVYGRIYTSSAVTANSVGTVLSPGTWAHVAVTYDRENLRTWINGVNIATTAHTEAMTPNDTPLTIGVRSVHRGGGADSFLAGQIDDVRVYDRALTASELLALAGGHPLSGTGTITLQDAFDSDGDLILGDGTLAAGANTITVAGDWTNESATFTYGTSTVDFDDDAQNNTITGDTTFYNLTISTGTTKTVTFASGDTTSIADNGTLTLTGAAGQLLTLGPGTAATDWLLDVSETGTTQNISYVSVTYSDASAGAEIAADDGTNVDGGAGGTNTNWKFAVRRIIMISLYRAVRPVWTPAS